MSDAVDRPSFRLGEDHLTVEKALAVTRGECHAYFSDISLRGIERSKRAIDKILLDKKVVYGINTGFGPLCNQLISPEETSLLQLNILKSHSVGVGNPLPEKLSKLMLLLKIHALARGFSGVRVETIERILWHFNHNVIPVVPRQGSVGASGDLAPLAHLFLPLIGLGKVHYQGSVIPTKKVLKQFGLPAIKLGPKEGLALINGTQFMVAYAIHIVDRLQNCLTHADIIGAMSVEALMGSAQPFREELHRLRQHPACQIIARRLRQLLDGSEIMQSHAKCERVQDPYSLRCIPQVHGASLQAWHHLKEITEIEMNSVTDNPIILQNGEALSGGNFHGQPIALPMDYAALAAAEIGNISDRRIYLMLEGKNAGLPKLLMRNTGLNSGFMLPQYTTAALVSENKTLCFPASADSIPTSLGQEDHVSMGSISGRKTLRIVKNLEKILAIELLCTSQAFDFHRPLKSGPILEACHAHIRQHIDHAGKDRVFALDIKKAIHIIRSRELIKIYDRIN
ncbi:MAG: histidine ammonia-lyase [Saprospiraceae bacterium]|nr:histidine ammonia-lyase [Saprospiraceae bacterium]